MRTATAVLVAGLLASTPAAAANLLSYTIAAAKLRIEGRTFRVTVHPKQNLILLQASIGESFSGGRADLWPVGTWRAAAEAMVTPIGCGISEVKVLSKIGGSWEAAYVCPEGVDLRLIYLAQRKQLDKGEPLRLPEAAGAPPSSAAQ